MIQIKSQHEHEDYNENEFQNPHQQLQPAHLMPVDQEPKKQKIRKIRIQSLPNQDPNHYLISDALIPQLQQSIALLDNFVFQAVSSKRKNIQLFVYTSLVEDGRDYLARLFKTEQKNRKMVHHIISETVTDINDTLLNEIMEGQHDVHKIARLKKQDILGGGKITQAAIRIKQQLLKAKLSDLKADINMSNFEAQNKNQSSFLNLNAADLYDNNSEKTKRAKQFVKRMQQMQQQQKREKQRKQQFQRQRKLEAQAERKQYEQRLKKQKHQYLKKLYDQKRQEKQQERKQQMKRNQEFQKFLDEFKGKTPLFKQKEKQFFQNYVIPQNNKKLQILKEIRQERKPLDREELKQHQKQYMQIKQDHHYQKNAAKALTQKTKKPDKNYYKSKFHSLIQKEQKQKEQEVDEFEVKLQMHKKKFQYSNEVKTKFIPKIDPKKKQEMSRRSEQLKSISKIKQIKDSDSYKKDGKDNLDKLHKYIAQLKAKGKVRYANSSRTIESSPQNNSARYKNYLDELRQSETSSSKQMRSRSINYSTLLASSEDAERVRLNLKRRESQAARRQQYLANLGGVNLQKYMEEKRKLDEDYLQSAKAKIALINKYQ